MCSYFINARNMNSNYNRLRQSNWMGWRWKLNYASSQKFLSLSLSRIIRKMSTVVKCVISYRLFSWYGCSANLFVELGQPLQLNLSKERKRKKLFAIKTKLNISLHRKVEVFFFFLPLIFLLKNWFLYHCGIISIIILLLFWRKN